MNLRRFLLLTVLLGSFAATAAPGANPIVSHLFTADPAARVFGDRLYVCTSHDEATAAYFDMFDRRLFSTADLATWPWQRDRAPRARVIRLATADGDIARTTGITLGGGTIKEDGAWAGALTSCPPADNVGRFVIRVPAASASLVKLPLP